MSTICCVIGAGNLGSRIAGELSRLGITVKIYDEDRAKVAGIREVIERHNAELGNLSSANPLRNVTACHGLAEALLQVDFIFEAIIDDLTAKQTLYEQIRRNAGENTIICSNTINLQLDEISYQPLFKERIIGCRFLSPVYYIPFVECTFTRCTSNATIQRVNSFFSAIGIEVHLKKNNIPRMLNMAEVEAYWNEARRTLEAKSRERATTVIPLQNVTRQESATTHGVIHVMPRHDDDRLRSKSFPISHGHFPQGATTPRDYPVNGASCEGSPFARNRTNFQNNPTPAESAVGHGVIQVPSSRQFSNRQPVHQEENFRVNSSGPFISHDSATESDICKPIVMKDSEFKADMVQGQNVVLSEPSMVRVNGKVLPL